MKKLILLLFLVILLLPAAAHAADPLLDKPHWSLELKGGRFAPALDNWSQYYGKRDMPEYEISLAYKIWRQVELGAGTGSIRGHGQAYAPLHGISTGDVTYELYPVNVFVLVRGIVNEKQWLVPYVGGGWTRMYYREQVQGQEKVSGSADGYHIRGGLQLSLDSIDRDAANSLYLDFGVYHTYLFVEAERTHAVVKSASIDLGGMGYLAGLLFEF